MILEKIRKSKITRIVCIYLAAEILVNCLQLNAVLALTGGPSQPEVESFTPIGTTEMVDAFSGDFNYNIPLMDVGGYPVNISYNSGISADQEASWVGLGWNLNVGSITRNMRSLPDDFNSDKVIKEMHMKDNINFGVTVGAQPEVFGVELENVFSLSGSLGITYNNYNGVGFETAISPTVSLSKTKKEGPEMKLGLGMGLSSSEDGVNVSPSLSLSRKTQIEGDKDNRSLSKGLNIGASFNSRQGLKSVNAGLSLSAQNKTTQDKKAKNDEKNISRLVDGMKSASRSVGSSVSFVNNTYVPTIQMARTNYSMTLKFAADLSLFGIDGSFPMSAYYSQDQLKYSTLTSPAYGYLYMQNGTRDNAMLDFTREKDQPFTQNTPNLPLTNFSYDQYNVSGQGVGGQYRAYRSDIGYVFDAYSNNSTLSGSGGVELGTGSAVDVGVDVNVATAESYSGKWNMENNFISQVHFNEGSVNSLFEPAYFKQVGEMDVESDPAFRNSFGGTKAVSVKLNKSNKFVHSALSTYRDIAGNEYAMTSSNSKRNSRAKRNQLMTFLTVNEISIAGITKYVSAHGKGHHLGEISILRPDGARYIYGIAAYNFYQKDATFNVSGQSGNCTTGLVTYSGTDNSTSNSRGRDEYFQSETLPAYAHSYLLTSVVSSDYVDVDAVPGPSEGDLGSYTKFNYDGNSQLAGVQPKVPEYQWRAPFQENKAAFNEGFKGDAKDDKGSYTYGKKELWYLESIETKTHVAVFETSQRKDGRGVKGENGGLDATSAYMYKLDRIKLYSREDYKELVNGNSSIKPLKTIHFEYDYSLCPGIENNDQSSELNDDNVDINAAGGKLTLRKIYITYEDSRLGKLSPYEFKYGDTDHDGTEESAKNPAYDLKGYDRWGSYKSNAGTDCSPTSTAAMPAPEFPYVEQNKALADANSSMWTLTDIFLPGGGKISVDFESDDYAYVQDRPAMEMFKIAGVGKTPSFQSNNPWLWDDSSSGTDVSNESDHVYIELPQEWKDRYPGGYDNAKFQKDFIQWISARTGGKLYFKFLTRINDDNIWEYVPGYAKIIDAGICSDNVNYAYIQVENLDRDKKDASDSDKNVNPFSLAAWNFARNYMPRVAHGYDDSNLNTGSLSNLGNALLNGSLVNSIIKMFKGPNGELRKKDYGKKINVSRSWIRLQSPNKKRLGGGSRVKRILISDEWDKMTENTGSAESAASYGQIFDYTTTEGGQVISSGVASYEPLIGGDENPFRQPMSFSEKAFLGPKTENYLETPFGESFFPAPSVGYSKVTVTDYLPDNIDPEDYERHGTGKTVQEFYTAKDFPTVVNYSDITPLQDKTGGFAQLFGAGVRDFMTVSQGYAVEINDMHGKQKASWVYASGKESPISGIEYKYHQAEELISVPATNAGSGGYSVTVRRLDNVVPTINADGSVENKEVGVEIDIINDFRESGDYTASVGAHGNLNSFPVPFPPLILALPAVLPSFSSSETRFRSVVTTKVINRCGIIREVVAHDLGSTVSTENVAFDAETGAVLLTKTTNEFEDAIYSFNYPAHWMYTGMGQAYKNIGLQLSVTAASDGSFTNSNLVPGDELIKTNGQKIWVYDNDPSDNTLYFMDENGLAVSGTFQAKVIRSGRRNQQQVNVGAVTCMANPIVNGQLVFNQASKILASGAVEFDQDWGLFCSAIPDGGATLTDRMLEFLTNSIPGGWNPTQQIFSFTPYDGGPAVSVAAIDYDNPLYQPVVPYSSPGGTNSIYCVGGVLTITNQDFGNELFTEGRERCYSLGNTINPYITGMRGNYRSIRSWTYLNGRDYATLSLANPDQQADGVFSAYSPFWKYTLGKWGTDDTDWTFVSEITSFSPYGLDLESRDALDRYSAQLLGYNNTFVKAVGQNADYNQLAFDGFEDYAYEQTNACCSGHFNFLSYSANLDQSNSHTGRYSMRVDGSDQMVYSTSLADVAPADEAATMPFTLLAKDQIGTFGPKTYKGTQKYVLSYWVKEHNPANSAKFDYPLLTCSVQVGSTSLIVGTPTRSKIIEGWQRVEIVFEIPASQSGSLALTFSNASGNAHYIDDVRIHPFNGLMKSYVIDPVSFRLWAELDERNFATFYEYNEEGKLLRIKKETERGVYTIQESRKGTYKKQ